MQLIIASLYLVYWEHSWNGPYKNIFVYSFPSVTVYKTHRFCAHRHLMFLEIKNAQIFANTGARYRP